MSRTVAILGGGDWADASVNHLEVPDELDLTQARAEWSDWWRQDGNPYLTFVEWLKRFKSCTDSDLEEFWNE